MRGAVKGGFDGKWDDTEKAIWRWREMNVRGEWELRNTETLKDFGMETHFLEDAFHFSLNITTS